MYLNFNFFFNLIWDCAPLSICDVWRICVCFKAFGKCWPYPQAFYTQNKKKIIFQSVSFRKPSDEFWVFRVMFRYFLLGFTCTVGALVIAFVFVTLVFFFVGRRWDSGIATNDFCFCFCFFFFTFGRLTTLKNKRN